MTPSDVAALLAYATGLDIRLQCSDETARLRIASWHDLLRDVPADIGRDAVRRHYAQEHREPITAAAILARWDGHPSNRKRPELPSVGAPIPTDVRAALAATFGGQAAKQRDPQSQQVIDAVACPWPPCRAAIGERCATWDGRNRNVTDRPHPSRTDMAMARV